MSREARSDKITGSLVDAGRPIPFVFDPVTGKLSLGEFEPQDQVSGLSDTDLVRLERRLSDLAKSEEVEVRVGTYHCYVCDRWLPATREAWSISICLSCSLDRGSELADRYFGR